MQQDQSQGRPSRATKRPYQPEEAAGDQVYIEARLHPLDVDLLLELAPGKQVAEAWTLGTAVPGIPRRLKLCSHSFHIATDFAEMTQELYDEGRKFWEEG